MAYARTTALVDIPAVIIPISGIVLCDKTAHVRVAFNRDQPKAHLCALIMLFDMLKEKWSLTKIQVFFCDV